MKLLFDIFDSLGLPYFRQGSLSDENYPDTFYTFQNFDSPNLSFYDDKSTRWNEKVEVYFYTNNPDLTYSGLEDFIKAAKAKNLVVEGRGFDTPVDKPNYSGRRITVNLIHKEE